MTIQREAKSIAEKILDLSWRISLHSAPMKPFLRFGVCRSAGASEERGTRFRRELWDFDDRLQKTLLDMLLELVTPDEIPQLCVDRWKQNLVGWWQGQKSEYERAVEIGAGYPYEVGGRESSIFDELGPNQRFLYVGCGAGRDCILLAQRGYSVVGIDTDEKLVEVSNRWAAYLGLDFQALPMDVMDLQLEQESFDGILLEFYGSWPLKDQILRMQKNLQRVLRPRGKAFVVATRKKYASYWYMARQSFPARMEHWLYGQTALDHVYSDPDAHESRLYYGLFNICHTVESLRRELSGMFDVVRCGYEEHDPRYILAVGRKELPCEQSAQTDDMLDELYVPRTSPIAVSGLVRKRLAKIEDVCTVLECHERSLIDYFMAAEAKRRISPLTDLGDLLPVFLSLLVEAVPLGERGSALSVQASG